MLIVCTRCGSYAQEIERSGAPLARLTGMRLFECTPCDRRYSVYTRVPLTVLRLMRRLVVRPWRKMTRAAVVRKSRRGTKALPEVTTARVRPQEPVASRLKEREASRRERAPLPYAKGFDTFDFRLQPSIDPRVVRELRSLRFVQERSNVLLLGGPGVGKTHLAAALAEEAHQSGEPVSFHMAKDLVRDLAQAYRENWLEQRMRAYVTPKVLVIDELGYLPLDATEAMLFYRLVCARYERGSIVLTSNYRCAEWAKVFGSVELASAIADRLLHHSTTIDIQGSSYRRRAQQPEATWSQDLWAAAVATGVSSGVSQEFEARVRW